MACRLSQSAPMILETKILNLNKAYLALCCRYILGLWIFCKGFPKTAFQIFRILQQIQKDKIDRNRLQ